MRGREKVNRAKKLRRLLGPGYSFQKYIGAKQIAQWKRETPAVFIPAVAARLTAGVVKMELVAFLSPDGPAPALDVFVKDAPDSREWICFDSLPCQRFLNESQMAEKLDGYVCGHGLSYTQCCFKKLEGENPEPDKCKKEGKPL